MKVLHVINNLGSGGAEKLLEGLIPLMNKLGNVKADVLLLTDKGNVFYDSFINKGVTVHVIKYKNMYDIRNIFEIKEYIVNGSYDVVHSHLFPSQYWVALSRMVLKDKETKFVTTEHSTYNRRRDKFFLRYVDKLIYSQYDSIISVTEETRDNLIDWIDFGRRHLHRHTVIENGVDIERIRAALPYDKSELIAGIGEHEKLICMVGRFSEAKDQPTLIRALTKLPSDVHLILVGEGPLVSDNKLLAEDLGVSDRVHFLGFRKDVPRILKTVDVVILSSHWEGLSLASVEGLASGKPFIASKVPGLEELVKGHGVLFEKGNYNQLSEIVSRLINDVKFYNDTAKCCLRQSQKYELKNTVRGYVNLYRQLYVSGHETKRERVLQTPRE